MNRLLIACALLAASFAEASAAEYICKLPNGKTSIQGSPCSHDEKTAYKNTSRYETQEEMQARVLDADMRVNEPRRRELAAQEAERAEARRQQREEDERRALAAAKERARREAAAAAIDIPLPGAVGHQPAPQPRRGMTCFQYGQFMDCK